MVRQNDIEIYDLDSDEVEELNLFGVTEINASYNSYEEATHEECCLTESNEEDVLNEIKNSEYYIELKTGRVVCVEFSR